MLNGPAHEKDLCLEIVRSQPVDPCLVAVDVAAATDEAGGLSTGTSLA